MPVRRKLFTAAALAAAALLSVTALTGAECRRRDRDAISLAYERDSVKPLVQARTFGGLPAPWDDRVPWFTLYGDGTVVTRGEGGANAPLLRGRMSPADVDTLLKRIRDAGFFELETFYREKEVYDHVYETVEVVLRERSHTVTVYFTKVDAFTAALDAIAAAPVSDLESYVPGRGFLVVQPHTATDRDAVVEEGSEVYGLLPDAAVLAWAASGHQPLVVDGEEFAAIKRYAAERNAAGLVLRSAGGDLIVYPVYEPR